MLRHMRCMILLTFIHVHAAGVVYWCLQQKVEIWNNEQEAVPLSGFVMTIIYQKRFHYKNSPFTTLVKVFCHVSYIKRYCNRKKKTKAQSVISIKRGSIPSCNTYSMN